jgi:hypothetical protein
MFEKRIKLYFRSLVLLFYSVINFQTSFIRTKNNSFKANLAQTKKRNMLQIFALFFTAKKSKSQVIFIVRAKKYLYGNYILHICNSNQKKIESSKKQQKQLTWKRIFFYNLKKWENSKVIQKIKIMSWKPIFKVNNFNQTP